jgi:hypothetical protein
MIKPCFRGVEAFVAAMVSASVNQGGWVLFPDMVVLVAISPEHFTAPLDGALQGQIHMSNLSMSSLFIPVHKSLRAAREAT